MTDRRYQQIAEELRMKIESGEIRQGDRLPTELELRDRYDAARNVVRDALQLLITQGKVETRQGQGWFAARRTAPLLITVTADQKDGLVGIEGEAAFSAIRRQGRSPSATVPSVEVHHAAAETAALLGVPAGSTVISRRQQWYVDRMPWALQSTAYPKELAEHARALLTAEDIEQGAVAYIEQMTDIKEVSREDLITSRQPNAEEAAFFQLPDGAHTPVAVVTRIGYQAGAGLTPLRVTTTAYVADHIRFAVSSGRRPHGVLAAAGTRQGSESA